MKNLLVILLIFSYFNFGILIIPEIQEKSNYEKIIKVIKEFEEFRAEKYTLFGYNYIGYGHLIVPGESYTKITKKKATELLKSDLQNKIDFFKDKVPERYLLLISTLAYNVKLTTILNSNFYQAVKNNETNKIDSMYLKFSILNGKTHKRLLERRKKEIKCFK